jgi:hypothetical protein
MEMSRVTDGRQMGSEENSNIQPKNKTKYRTPRDKMERSAYSLRERNSPRKALSMKMTIIIIIVIFVIGCCITSATDEAPEVN